MTVAYISHLFKKQMGIGIVDYINRFRIEKAKELLIDPRLKLNDIAEILGYANDAAFIRVFKKYEGVTPGRYREVLSIKRIIEL
jgi:YesN/AraC family two-component response regulator